MENLPPAFPAQDASTTKKKPIWIVAVLVLILLLLGGFFLFRKSGKTSQSVVTVSPTQEPSPTEKPKIDKQSVKIQVLNGTGTPGQAGKVADVLKKEGFNIDNIKTDNAKDDNHAVTIIAAKAGFEDVANDIKTALGTLFDKVEIDSSPLSKDNEFDAVITTGGKKYETPTPKTTTTLSPTRGSTNTPTPSTNPTSTPTSTPSPTP